MTHSTPLWSTSCIRYLFSRNCTDVVIDQYCSQDVILVMIYIPNVDYVHALSPEDRLHCCRFLRQLTRSDNIGCNLFKFHLSPDLSESVEQLAQGLQVCVKQWTFGSVMEATSGVSVRVAGGRLPALGAVGMLLQYYDLNNRECVLFCIFNRRQLS